MTSPTNTKPFVRLYDPAKDELAIHRICQQTLPPSLRAEPACFIAPYIWAVPYVRLCPSHCFVIDSGSGAAVGYIIGTPSTKEFITRYRSDYITTLDTSKFPHPKLGAKPPIWSEELPKSLLHQLYTPEELLHEKVPRLLEQYPAHLHIDLLEEYQRKGFGRQLMDKFLGTLRDKGVKGVHLIMAGENKNGGFYGRMEFERFKEVLDGGTTGEMGRDSEDGIWFVKSL